MRTARGWLVGSLVLIALASSLVGLVQRGFPHRCVVDPAACSNDSDYIEARGYPVSWLVTEPLDDLELPFFRRVLTSSLIFDLLALLGLTASNWMVFALSDALSRRIPSAIERLASWGLPAGYIAVQLLVGRLLFFDAGDLAAHVASFLLVATAYVWRPTAVHTAAKGTLRGRPAA